MKRHEYRDSEPVRGMALALSAFGVLCVCGLLAQAVVRLTPLALEPLTAELPLWQLGLYVAWVVFNAYAEGYRAFQLRFCPRVVSRALYLGRHPRALWLILALPFCMSLFHSTRRQKIVSWTFVIVIVLVVIAVRSLPQPWRGIIDGGVVIGLGWGILSLLVIYVRAVVSGREPVTVDIPLSDPEPVT